MAKKALIVWGGWDGHTPKQSAEVFAPELEAAGYDVTVKDSMAPYADHDYMKSLDLIVPIWTMGKIEKEQWQGLDQAVRSGVGLAGFHGGIIDAFRDNTEYQWMTGGQWVAHPGNCIPDYRIDITDAGHEITKGLSAFDLKDTEQYYCHIDPAVHVLCTTTFSGKHGDASLYEAGAVMPYAWTKRWGDGRVFVAAWGHTHKDFDVPEAKEIVRRGMLWASR
ncbi:MAG: ThuA domain-containing protein [Phycisphaeraceae bacterium]